MKRFALILAVVVILCVSAGQAQAKRYHHGHGGYHRGHGGYHHGYHSSVIVRSPVWAHPPVVVRPRVVYPPVYNYRYYAPYQSFGFQYHGRGVSVGVGF